MSKTPIKLLILGLGNLLVGDDGAGIRAVEVLARQFEWPEGVEVLDGGTLGLALLPLLQDAHAAILVDAIRTEEKPGTLRRLEQDQVLPVVLERLSPHQIGVADLIGAADLLGQAPEPLVLMGVVVDTIELGVGLSPAVNAALPRLVDSVVAEASKLGWKPRRRASVSSRSIDNTLECGSLLPPFHRVPRRRQAAALQGGVISSGARDHSRAREP